MPILATFDWGGSELKVGRLDLAESDRVITLGVWPSPTSLEEFFENVRAALSGRETNGAALAVAGVVKDHRKIYDAPNLFTALKGTNLKDRIEAEFGLPCWVVNDLEAAGAGE